MTLLGYFEHVQGRNKSLTNLILGPALLTILFLRLFNGRML